MDLLVVSTWFPCPPDNGSRLRAFHLMRGLAEQGHRIRLITGVQDDIADRRDDAALHFCEEIVAVPWRWFGSGDAQSGGGLAALLSRTPRSITLTENPALRRAVAEKVAARKPDAILALELGVAPMLPVSPDVPIVLDQVEVSGWDRGSGLRSRLTRAKAVRYWHRGLRRVDAITSVSEAEAVAVRRVVGSEMPAPPVVVVPNGVSVADYPTDDSATPPSPGRMIYNGSPTYGPNRDAVVWFAEQISPQIRARVPEAHLVVTGRRGDDPDIITLDNGRTGIEFTGFVPDLRPVLRSASVCVVPLRSGGGTRLKILEAFAAGIPVVSTTIGAAGLDAIDGEHLILADDPSDFADAVVRVLQTPDLAARLSRAARGLVEQKYDWQAITIQLSAVIDGLVRTRIAKG